MSGQAANIEPEAGMPIDAVIGKGAVMYCGPEVTPNREAQMRNGLTNAGVQVPDSDRTSVQFGCKVVPEQVVKPTPAMPQPSMAPTSVMAAPGMSPT